VPSLERDGVRLFFEEREGGSPPFLFVHAWGADHTHFAPQLEYFGGDHRTIAVDLRGHGQSDKPERPYTMEAFADDVAWMCGELRIDRPVVVGHSMGGVVALVLAADFPQLPRALVALDAPILPTEQLAAAGPQLTAGMRSPAFREVTRQFYSMVAGFDDQPASKERLIDGLASGEQHVMASAMEQVFAYDTASAASRCNLPFLYIAAGAWVADIARLRELCPQLLTGQTVGAGHFHQLEVPEQLNPMIARFVRLLGQGDSGAA